MYSEDEINSFYNNYRESLSRQKEAATRQLEQQRENDYATIMSGANKAGMMYSNFPARDKIKYEQSTFQPNLVKLNTAYQTGLQTLRSNIANYKNSIADIQDAINHLNSLT